MDVSFIIVSWNGREYLRQCLSSISSNGGAGIAAEIIVIDNASTDGSPEMVAEFFPGVVLVRLQENLGFAKGNNIGIARARGRYLALVNSDVELRKGCMETLVQFMDTRPKVGLVGPRILNADGSLQSSCRRFPRLWRVACRTLALDDIFPRLTHPAHESGPVDVLSGCFWFARKAAIDEVGNLDERFFMYSEDVDWCRRFRDAGWGVQYVPQAEAVHYGGASSRNAPVRFYIEMYRAQLQYQRKHGGPLAALAFGALVFLHQAIRWAGQSLVAAVRPAARTDAAYKARRSLACMKWLLRYPVAPRPPVSGSGADSLAAAGGGSAAGSASSRTEVM